MQAISKNDLKQMNEQRQDDFVLINVLGPDAFKEKHIRTSINVPQERDDFTAIVETVASDKGRKVVVYCANFDCPASPKAAEKLEAAGFSHVYDYEGGTQDWFAD